MAAQPHHSIGEVLSLLQAEYSDCHDLKDPVLGEPRAD